MNVTIVYGFLGSGKTTFLRSLIPKLAVRERVAVLVNEMGEVGIDGTVLESDEMNVQMLPNGCICCELRGDLFLALKELEKRFHPERLVIEPTGLAAPNQIDEVFDFREIAEFASVDSRATILDANKYELASRAFGKFFEDQISQASLVLINKADLVNEEDLDRARKFVRDLNPAGQMYVTTYCDVDPMLVFGANGADDSSHDDEHDHHHEVADSTQGMETLSIQPPKIARSQVQGFLKSVEQGRFGEVVRAKGFIETGDGMVRIEYVMGSWDIHEFGSAAPRVEFIGTGLRRSEIEEALHAG
ncbi:MAG: GTP-binding protein [Chloroflexi bacterium]|nr:GTP-binding protein [Chloroflexota bacterium]